MTCSTATAATRVIHIGLALLIIAGGGVAALVTGVVLTIGNHAFCGDSGSCTPLTYGDIAAALAICSIIYFAAVTVAAGLALAQPLSEIGRWRRIVLVAGLSLLVPSSLLVTLWVNEHHHGHAVAVATFVVASIPGLLAWLALARALSSEREATE